MKLFLGLLGFSLLFTDVLANAWSAPYQAILTWYAYRMDVKTYGVGNTYIATACTGSLTDGSCTFDELLKYMQKEGNWASWTGSTGVGDTLNPDVLKLGKTLKEMNAANAVGSAGYYTYKEDWSKILPNTFAEGARPSFYAAYVQLINTIQLIRQGAPDLDVDISDELDNAKRAMILADDGRQYDDATHKITALNSKIASFGASWTVETKTVYSPEGYTWLQADVEATLTAHPDASEDLRNAVRKLGTDWGTSVSENDGSRGHSQALVASSLFESTLLGDNTCEI